MSDESEKTDTEEWESEDVEVERPVTAVVSVRLPNDLAHRIALEASNQGLAVSALVREAVTAYLESVEAGRANYDWTVSSPDVSVAFYAGRAGQGRTAGSARTLEEALLSRT
jgi:hypothetical protein